MSQTIACSRCGGPLTAEHRFCSQCGATNPVHGGGAAPSPSAGPWDMVQESLRAATRGEFEIAGELGHGGMAAVYLAHDIALDKKVAIKVMAPTLMADPSMVDRFRQEARTVAKLEHQHIVTVHAARQTGGLHFFVMKYIEGKELGDVLHQVGPLPLRIAQAILYEIGAALAYAHSAAQPVIHRDVKPSNIMLDTRGNAVLTDFGIAKLKGGQSHTMHGAAIGTPQYMSPEQCLAQPVTQASDQYSLGMVAYHVLVGQPPFQGDPLTVMRMQIDERLPPIGDLPEGPFPVQVRTALDRMLDKDPTKRWPTVLDAVRGFGGAPMAPGDPVKEDIVRLVKTPDFIPPTEVFTTPMSPSPGAAAHHLSDPSFPTEPLVPPTSVDSGPQAPPTPPASHGVPATPPPAAAPSRPRPPAPQPVGAATPPPSPSPTAAPGSATAATAASGAMPGTVAIEAPASGVSAAAEAKRPFPAKAVAAAAGLVIVAGLAGALLLRPGPEPAPASPVVVTIDPADPVLQAGDQRQLQAAGFAGGGPVAWTTSDTSVATVDQAGLVRAVGPGAAVIVARSGTDSGFSNVHVAAEDARLTEIVLNPSQGQVTVGDTIRLVAEQYDQRGNRMQGDALRWRSEDVGAASVDGNGTVRGRAGGTVTIVASRGDVQARARITVQVPAPPEAPDRPAARTVVARVSIQPPSLVLVVGASRRLQARPLDGSGRGLDRPVSWRSDNPAVVTVDQNGDARAVAAGRARIHATSDETEGSIQVQVQEPAPVIDPLTPPKPPPTPDTTARRPPAADSTPPKPPPAPARASLTGIAAGGAHTCVFDGAGASWCWGRNNDREVAAAGGATAGPTARAGTSDTVVAGGQHTCALRAGQLTCWGRNTDGQLGSANRNANEATVRTPSLVSISLGAEHSCGLTASGQAFCWGKNDRGQVGDGSTSRRTEPVAVAADSRFTQLAAGGRHTCGVTRANRVECWGDNWSGQVGSGLLQNLPNPTAVEGNRAFQRIVAGFEFTCGLSGGAAFCWGKNGSGQLGDGSTSQRTSPTAVRTTVRFASIVAGGEHVCAVDPEGRAFCWGRGREGQLGNGQTDNQRAPVAVGGSHRFRALAAGDRHTCGVTQDDQVLCWGENASGQLGAGGRTSSTPRPVPVR